MEAPVKVSGSTPTFSNFVPLPGQMNILSDIDHGYDYSLGMHEALLSGSVGSSKSLLLAHAAIKHCLKYQRARVLVGRRSTPDLRLTIWKKILEHLEGSLIEGQDYTVNLTRLEIVFSNKSEIICRSWADGQYLKLRSLELSAAIVEEIVENGDNEKQAYDEICMRVGRLPHIKENWILAATNPSSPGHWVYNHFIAPNQSDKKHPTRRVYYSVTTDNPYLPPQYIAQLERDLDPKMARRMIYGEWLEIAQEVVYHAYARERNFRDVAYTVNPAYPVYLSWDFNIGVGKPLSMCLMQFIQDTFHIFNEVVVHGMRTEDSCEELAARGFLDLPVKYIVTGDASGKHRDTRSKRSDYDLITGFLSNYRTQDGRALVFESQVPSANPPIRTRHNRVNAYCQNALNQVRLFVYQQAPTVDKGMRLTQLKKKAEYIEDDSKEYQHVTTSVGYALMVATRNQDRKPQGTVRF